jgi:hypothetical protein
MLEASPTVSKVLAWDYPTANEDGTTLTDLAGCKLYWGATPHTYQYVIDVGYTNRYQMTNSTMTGVVYLVGTAYNTAGNESGYSTELVYCAWAPAAPLVSYSYNVKQGKLTVTITPPTKGSDGSTLTNPPVGYNIGYGPTPRTGTLYPNSITTNVASFVMPLAPNSGTWYFGVSAINNYGAYGAYSVERSVNTKTPKAPRMYDLSVLDLR